MNPAPTAVAFRATIHHGDQTAARFEVPEVPVTLAPDVIDALAGDGEAGWRFADLSDAEQRRWVLAIDRARTRETRRRRIDRTVATLRAGGA